jgi:hypothetical protein
LTQINNSAAGTIDKKIGKRPQKARMAAMSRANWIHAFLVVLVVVIVLVLVRLHGASGIG